MKCHSAAPESLRELLASGFPEARPEPKSGPLGAQERTYNLTRFPTGQPTGPSKGVAGWVTLLLLADAEMFSPTLYNLSQPRGSAQGSLAPRFLSRLPLATLLTWG